MRRVSLVLLTALLLPMAISVDGIAATDDESSESAGDTSDEAPGKTEGADVRVAGKEGEKELDPSEIDRAKQAEMANSPVELPNKTYYFVGLRYRGMLIPRFMMTAFGDGGTSVFSHGLGPELTVRKNNFEYVLSAWWTGYDMSQTRFKAPNDPEQSYEYVTANLNVLYLTSDFNWTSQISPVFGLNFGVGAGFGFVWGDIIRNEAYRDASGVWHRCNGPEDQMAPAGYCGPRGGDEQYDYNEPNWANGGSKPIVFPWLALQTGARIKPHRNFMMRIDAGWAITGPFFGISGNYGI